jgi:hypothetical protein
LQSHRSTPQDGEAAGWARMAVMVVRHWLWLLPTGVSLLLGLPRPDPALAIDDHDFCVVAKRVAAASKQDVGNWTDRVTRNAGMVVACDKKRVEFLRFTYEPSSEMTAEWAARKTADWSAAHCASLVWREAIRSGWKVVLSVTFVDRRHVELIAQCPQT